MGGRALVAVLAAAAQAFWLAALIAGPACAAEVPAGDEPAGVAAAPLVPAPGDDRNSHFTAPASAIEDEPPVDPAAAPAGEIDRDPADATDTAATPNENDRKPTDTPAVAPNETEHPPETTSSPRRRKVNLQPKRRRPTRTSR